MTDSIKDDSLVLLNDGCSIINEDFGIDYMLQRFFHSLHILKIGKYSWNGFSVDKTTTLCSQLSQQMKISENEADSMLQDAWKKSTSTKGRNNCIHWLEWITINAKSDMEVECCKHYGNNDILPIETHFQHTLEIYFDTMRL